MPRAKIDVLKSTSPQKHFAVRIPTDVVQRVTDLEKRLASEAPDLSFDRSAIVSAALTNAVRQAHSTLDQRKSGT